MRRRWLTIAVILTAPSGCDNVRWGGIDVRLETPPTRAEAPAAPAAAPEDSTPLPPVVSGPFLMAGTRKGDSATLVVVGLVKGDSLGAFPSDASDPGFRARFAGRMLAQGTDLVLFSDGVRVGHLSVASTGVDSAFCVPRPTASGVVELVPQASDAQRFLALPTSAAGKRPYAPYHTFHHTYDQRVASLNLAAAAIPKLGAAWPTALLDARADIQAFQVADTDAFAATFLFKDRMAVGAPEGGAYSLFVMGTNGPNGYQESYLAYRPADDQGKGDPRYFDHLDWSGDGRPEILLDVFGARNRWFAGLTRRPGGWVQTFQDPCGVPAAGR